MKILIGGKGKMGKLLREHAIALGHTVTAMVDTSNLYVLETTEPADLILDFSHRDNLGWIIDYVNRYDCALVYGTTGLTEEQLVSLNKLAENHRVFYSTNFSYGIAVLQELIKTAVPLLKDTFDIELVEMHHSQKADAPSGTAKTILSILNKDNDMKEVYGREGMVGARQKEIGVHSVRGGTEAGEHKVLFLGDSESITLTHHANDRQIFVNGALRAARFLINQKPGMYGMHDLLFSKPSKEAL